MAKIEFSPPKSFMPPEGTEDGDSFEANATFRLKGDKLCLEKIDGAPMPGYEDDKGEKAEDRSSFGDRYKAAMAQPETNEYA